MEEEESGGVGDESVRERLIGILTMVFSIGIDIGGGSYSYWSVI